MKLVQRAKSHLQENKKTHLACGVTAVVVAGVTYYVFGKTQVINVTDVANVKLWSPTTNNIAVEFIERSCPSKIVAELSEDGQSFKQAFSSINEAAKQTGIDRAAISKCISGKQAHAGGRVFQELAIGD